MLSGAGAASALSRSKQQKGAFHDDFLLAKCGRGRAECQRVTACLDFRQHRELGHLRLQTRIYRFHQPRDHLDSRVRNLFCGRGVRASTVRLIDERGDLVGTGNALDLAIAGRGMLPVINEVSLGNALSDTPLLMTRTGSFRTDADGVMKTDSGLVLLGWPADADGTIPSNPRDTIWLAWSRS